MRHVATVASICLLLVWLAPLTAVAQFNGFSGLDANASLSVSPQFPEPTSQVEISINDYSLAGNTVAINWLIDGTEVEAFADQRSIRMNTGPVGEPMEITAVLRSDRQQETTLQTTITPSSVLLIVEPYTTAPSWYNGRPLPSVGSTVRVVALPYTGSDLSPDAYTYTWRFENKVAGGGPVRGQYENTFTMPFGNSARLAVDISDPNGRVVAKRTIIIPNQEPELYFYANNPLRGMSKIALADTVPLVGNEMTLRGEAFHMGAEATTRDIVYEWKVNSRTVENPNADPQTITVQNGGGTGNFRVEFEMQNTQDLLQRVHNSFNLVF